MTEEHAMGYKSADGKRMDFKKLDADADGRVSQKEWTGYHTAGATRSDGSKDHGADDRGGGGVTGPAGTDSSSGAAGPSGGGASDSGVGVNRDAPKDSDPSSGGRGSN